MMHASTLFPDAAASGTRALPVARQAPAPASAHRLLLMTDDAAALPPLQAGLSAEGLFVQPMESRADAAIRPARGSDEAFDAVLMWVTGSLAAQLGRLRALRRLALERPLLVACNGVRELDQVLALEMGADDVLDTTWSAPVVAARLRARWRASAARSDIETSEDELRFGGLHLLHRERRVARHGAIVPLTEGEFEVLWLLASHAGMALTRAEILRRVRGLDDQPTDRSIDCRVYRIRAKLGDGERGRQRIRTVRNRGYVFLPTDW